MNKTSEDVQQMIAQADKDKNGSMELNEFIELVASIMGKTIETEETPLRKTLSVIMIINLPIILLILQVI